MGGVPKCVILRGLGVDISKMVVNLQRPRLEVLRLLTQGCANFYSPFASSLKKRGNFGNGDDALSLSFNAGLEIDHRRHIARSNWSGHVGPSFYLYRGALYLHHRLYGATNVQVYFYFRKYPKDRMILRCIVPFLWYVRSCDDEPVFTNAIGRWIRFIWPSQSMSCGIILSSRSEIIKLSFL